MNLTKEDLNAIQGLLQPIIIRLDSLESRIDSLESRMDKLESKIDRLETRMTLHELEFSNFKQYVENKFNEIDKRFIEVIQLIDIKVDNLAQIVISRATEDHDQLVQNTSDIIAIKKKISLN